MYLIIWNQSVLAIYTIIIILSIALYLLITKEFKSHRLSNSKDTYNEEILTGKIIHISVNAFRSLVFVLTTLNILAVDFDFYDSNFSKSDHWGISLMDTGVGYFIICHSMRFIRNTKTHETETVTSKYFN